jgi:propanol-preferring alcohol dehydrogenase
MRAMQLAAPRPVDRRPLLAVALPEPEPEPEDIVLDVSACAVCRTDLQITEGDVPAHRLPLIPGHQAVGRVTGVGAAARGWSVGDRAGVGWLGGADGTCRFCRSGRENLCAGATFMGWDRDGGFADRIVVRAAFAIHLPAGFDDLAAAPLLCGGVIGYRALRVSGIQPGGRLGLYGFGSSASLAIQVARHWGCEVHVRTRSRREQERALELGAASAAPTDEPTPTLDAAVTFAPSGDVAVAALRNLDRGAALAINAIHLDRIPEFSYDLLWLERSLRSVANFTRADATEFIELAATIPIRTAVRPYPLDEANEALRGLKAGDIDGTAVLTMGGPSVGPS